MASAPLRRLSKDPTETKHGLFDSHAFRLLPRTGTDFFPSGLDANELNGA